MALKIRFKKTFEKNLQSVVSYLDTEWNDKITDQFLEKLWDRISRLTSWPFAGVPSLKISGVRSVFITKHNRLFYRVTGDYLVILMLHDTRLNPKKNRY